MMHGRLLFFIALAAAACQLPHGPLAPPADGDPSFVAAHARLANAVSRVGGRARARNVVIFVGDGMDLTTVTAARIRAGQLAGKPGEAHELSWERFPSVSLVKTYNSNQQVPDSAGTATALFSGVKTKAGVIGVKGDVVRGDCASSQAQRATSLFELAEAKGIATGVVSTARITHATPAAAYAHGPERAWEVDLMVPDEEKAAGCDDFAAQLVNFGPGDGLEVALGGGRRFFLPQAAGGVRADGRNLVATWRARSPEHAYVTEARQLDSLSAGNASHVLGLFHDSHMNFELDRPATEPTLADMTEAALQVLSDAPDGFLLHVEAGRIDHAHHQGNAQRALQETIELSDAVAAAIRMTDARDTLIIVTADHGHTMTMAGYPTRGNPILDVVRGNDWSGVPTTDPTLAADGKPYTTLGYMNGPGAVTGTRPTPTDTDALDYLQQSLYGTEITLPTGQTIPVETHGGQDVPLWASGPGANLFQGTIEQNYVFHVMRHALGL